MFDNIKPVILSGGSGTRLWPLSRKSRPKQFIPLVGKKSLFQMTLERVGTNYGFSTTGVIGNENHRFVVLEQASQCNNVQVDSVVLEPIGKNTAPAVIIAALLAYAENQDQLLLLLPADHIIMDVPAFHNAILEAAKLASNGHFVCFGIEPSHAETGYGYIKAADKISEAGFKVDKFVEKPNKETAEAYLAEGGYSWNSGMFLFKASAVLEAFKNLNPKMLSLCTEAFEKGEKDLDFLRLDNESFSTIEEDSIDYALMEKVDNAAVIPVDMGWSDVGSYSALWENGDKDQDGNVTHGDVTAVDTENSYLRAIRGNISTVGIRDLIVIKMPDVTLVADKNRDQDIKLIVNKMKTEGRAEVELPPRVYRPWGSYKSLVEEEGYQVKEIIVKPGKRLSLQSHNHRAEHWVIVSGTAIVQRDNEERLMKEDESIYLPLGCVHRLTNPGKIDLKLIEVQTGTYLGEDDIIRYEDDFKRSSDD